MRLLQILMLSGLATGCARLPEIQPCDETGEALAPVYLNLGNNDQLSASLQYTGCEDYHFDLCGAGSDWLQEDEVHLAIWHDDSLRSCNEDVLVDEIFQLRGVRERYEDAFDVTEGTFDIRISDVIVEYSFTDEP